ncbi:hypothetical protein ASF44_03475 [Pseudorhodoferax sp. Leaf274]|nr:hypothetical protein ASF44_03475 [Pseudorhodoferax sp. Leaf274]
MHVFASTARQMTQRAHRGIDHVVVRMDDARALHSRGLLGADEADGVVLSRRATGGLTFRLVESATA